MAVLWWYPCQKYRTYTVYDRIYGGIPAKTLDICIVYDRIFGGIPAKNTVHTPYMIVYMVVFLQKYRMYTVYDRVYGGIPAKIPDICTVYDRIFGEFSAKHTVCTLCMHVILANPNCKASSAIARCVTS